MSETTDDLYTEDPDAPGMVRMSRENIKRLEAKANRNPVLERENAFLKAGMPVEDPKLSYFIKGYDGPLTPDAIRAEAVAAGFMTAPAPTEAEQQIATTAAAAQRVADAAATAGNPDTGSASTREQEYRQARAEGGPAAMAAVAAKYGSVVGH